MHKFLTKTLLFIVVLIGLMLSILMANRLDSDFHVAKETSILLVGHSHSATAFDDSLIPQVENYSQLAEEYFYNYVKLKQLLPENPQLNILLVEFSNNNIEMYMDNSIWDDQHISEKFPVYGAFMNFNDYKFLYNKNLHGFVGNLPSLIQENTEMLLKRLKYNKNPAIGGYFYLRESNVDSLLKNPRENEFYAKDINEDIAADNLYYLRKIIDYSRQKGMTVYLVRSPLRPEWITSKNEPIFQEIRKSRFSDVEFLDFSKIPISATGFKDFHHLNHKGATEFSTWFSSLVKKGLFEKSHKQSFINKEIKRNEW